MERSLSFHLPIKDELAKVNDNIRSMTQIQFLPLGDLLGETLSTSGKRMRPGITILASQFMPSSDEASILMATAVELLHIATLIHDDTVDNASLRRGKPTVSGIWGPNVAVLVGDYVFAASATFVCDTKNVRVIRRYSETIMELSSGQLMERFSNFDPNQTQQQYEERIYNKTACLFSTAAESGAVLSDADEGTIQALKCYGRSLGMAFQIIDDILDIEATSDEMGKPVGSDLKQGTLTLPAILALERYPNHNPIVDLFAGNSSELYLKQSLDMLHNSTVIQDSYSIAEAYGREAKNALASLSTSTQKKALLEACDYVLERNN